MTSRSSMGETLDILTLLRQYPAAPVDIETRMHPATQHPGTLRRKQECRKFKRTSNLGKPGLGVVRSMLDVLSASPRLRFSPSASRSARLRLRCARRHAG